VGGARPLAAAGLRERERERERGKEMIEREREREREKKRERERESVARTGGVPRTGNFNLESTIQVLQVSTR
jgi:hypothetical protein